MGPWALEKLRLSERRVKYACIIIGGDDRSGVRSK